MARRLSSLLPWDAARRSAALYAQSEDDIAAVLAIPFQRVAERPVAERSVAERSVAERPAAERTLAQATPAAPAPEQALTGRGLRAFH